MLRMATAIKSPSEVIMKYVSELIGMKHCGTESLVASLPAGEPLTLVREPNNAYDRNAIQVWARGQHVGYVRATQARQLAMAMDNRMARDKSNSFPVTVFGGKLATDGSRWPLIETDWEE